MPFGLRVLNGPYAGREIQVAASKFVIGRDKSCQLRATSKMISRKHCELNIKRSRLFVRDLLSRNGTFVNDKRAEADRQLEPGDCLKVGKLEFLVLVDEELGRKKKSQVKDVSDAVAQTMRAPMNVEKEDADVGGCVDVLADDESERHEGDSEFFSPGDTQIF